MSRTSCHVLCTWIISTWSSSTGSNAASWRRRLKPTLFSCRKIAPGPLLFSSSNVFVIFGRFKRFDIFGWSDRVLKGVRRALRRGLKSWSCKLNRSRFTGVGHTWNTTSEMLSNVWGGGGGFAFFGGGFAKRGVRPNPLNPLWLRAWITVY